MTKIVYLKKIKPHSPNSPDAPKISLPRNMHAVVTVVDFTKTRSELISGITQSTYVTDVFVLTTSCFAVQFRASFKGKISFVQHLEPVF